MRYYPALPVCIAQYFILQKAIFFSAMRSFFSVGLFRIQLLPLEWVSLDLLGLFQEIVAQVFNAAFPFSNTPNQDWLALCTTFFWIHEGAG